jgi:hypothetical protein
VPFPNEHSPEPQASVEGGETFEEDDENSPGQPTLLDRVRKGRILSPEQVEATGRQAGKDLAEKILSRLVMTITQPGVEAATKDPKTLLYSCPIPQERVDLYIRQIGEDNLRQTLANLIREKLEEIWGKEFTSIKFPDRTDLKIGHHRDELTKNQISLGMTVRHVYRHFSLEAPEGYYIPDSEQETNNLSYPGSNRLERRQPSHGKIRL